MSKQKSKILYIVSSVDKALAFEWVDSYLNKELFAISFVILGKENSELYKYLIKAQTPVYEIRYLTKKDLVLTFIKVLKIIIKIHPHIVHTHLFDANIIGLTAAWFLGIKKRIYTRHHATTHYNEYPKGLKWDKWCNFIATHIVAISRNVQEILIDRDKATSRKVHLIHHGFDFDYFRNVSNERVKRIELKYNITDSHRPRIGVIARYIEWKGVQFTIQAFKKLLEQYPLGHLILANAGGDYKNQIQVLLNELPASCYTEIPFEYDIAALYKLFDVFVHVPIDKYSEAFGQTYIEPLIIGIPAIFTKSGIAYNFIENEKNALVVNYNNARDVTEAIIRILTDKELTESLIKTGKKSTLKFTIQNMISKLEAIYAH